jgi:DNA topoisomerase IB
VQQIADPEIRPLIEALKRRRSGHPELLAFKQGRRWIDVRSEDINAYLKDAAGGDFSAKDFRTWNATLLAALGLASIGPAETETARKRGINDAVKGVALFLGNTPAVCRQSYIDPRVLDRYRDGETITAALNGAVATEEAFDPKVQRRIELAVLRLIEN